MSGRAATARGPGARSYPWATRSHQPCRDVAHPSRSRWARATMTWAGESPLRSTTPSRLAGSHPRASRTTAPAGSGGGRTSTGRAAADARAGSRQTQRHQDVGGVARRRAPVGEEGVGVGRRRAADRAGHGHDGAAALGGRLDRVAGPAPGVGLDHDHHLGQGGDDPVADREPPRLRGRAERRLADQQAGGGHVGPQLGVALRVDDVDAAADHGDRRRSPTAASAPAWAAPSMPAARPDTILTPLAARSRPSSWARSRP